MYDGQQHRQRSVVLIVDDDMALRLLMRESLEQAGLIVEEAENGFEALSTFEDMHPALVLLDVKMPKMDGFTACSKLRQLPGGEDTPVVMVTGLDDFESIQHAYDVGATDFITKPINWPILNHRVRYLLRARDAFQALRRSEAKLSQAQRVARLGNWDWNLVTNEFYSSDEIYRILGLESQTFNATYENFLSLVHPEDMAYVTKAVDEALHKKKPYSVDHRIIRMDGTELTVYGQGEVIPDKSGKPLSMHGTLQDITERKNTEEKIRFLAYYDVLTGLPNRKLFKKHAISALRIAQLEGTKVALICLDLDRFKRINDTLGHKAGDDLLKIIAKQITNSIRDSDVVAKVEAEGWGEASLSRLGGDEFTVLLTGLTQVDHAAKVAKRIQENLSTPVKVEGQEFFVTASMGIAIYPMDGEDIETLLKNADTAVYHAKDEGGNNFQFYAKYMNSRILEKLSMETKLKKALEQDELVLFYQPQVEAGTGKIVGLEALIRWEHPDMGLILPGKFIPLAEETGLIIPIGEWVLQTACTQALTWQQAGFIPLRMGVNLSGHQFRKQDIVKSVQQILDATHLDPQYLELELTESVLMSDAEDTISKLQRLKETGLKLSVDDFGTGYSSMSYLKRFPLDTLKIDRCFIKDIMTDSNDAAITKAIIALAKSLGMTTIAEGVETEEQLTFLRQQGCDQIQGYLISRPVPAEKIVSLLKTGRFCEGPLSICLEFVKRVSPLLRA